MKRIYFSLAALLIGIFALASCGGGSSVPSASQKTAAAALRTANALQTSCYDGDKHRAYTTEATVTFYGWPDNSPPGNQIAHPVIHHHAAGIGSFCDPTTFATEPTPKENALIPYGTRIYVPYMQKYFIREDDCTTSGPQGLGCSGVWFDLWIGGDAQSYFPAVIECENRMTMNTKVDVIVHARPGEPVSWLGPIYNDIPPPKGSCDKPE
jgi:hypothetical protein